MKMLYKQLTVDYLQGLGKLLRGEEFEVGKENLNLWPELEVANLVSEMGKFRNKDIDLDQRVPEDLIVDYLASLLILEIADSGKTKSLVDCPFCGEQPELTIPEVGPWIGFFRYWHRCKVSRLYFNTDWQEKEETAREYYNKHYGGKA